ncbi:MAG: MG2 domain-containing protein [bacterium]
MKRFLIYLVTGLIFGIVAVSGDIIFGFGDTWMNINIQSNYQPGEAIVANIGGRDISTSDVELTLFRIDLEELMFVSADKGNLGDLNDLKLKNLTEVKKWTVKLPKQLMDEYWIQDDITFDNPGVGAYLLQAKAGDAYSVRMFMVTGIAAVVKGDDRQLVIFAAERKSGAAAAGAKVSILKDGKWMRAVADENGIARLEGKLNGQYPIVVIWKDNPAVMNAYFYSGDNFDKQKAYVYTDRPIYRPNQTVNIRGIIRTEADAGYKLPEGKTVKITIRDPRGNEVSKTEAELSEFGSYSTEYKIGEEPPLGQYNVVTEIDGSVYNSEFSIEEYRKPEYEISVTPDSDTYVQGDALKFTVDAKYYFGEPVKKAAVSYTLYRRQIYWYWWESDSYSWYYRGASSRYGGYYNDYMGEQAATGRGATDDKGNMIVSFADTKMDQDMQYTLVVRVTDQGRKEVSGTGGAKVMRGEFSVNVKSDKYVSAPGEKVWIKTTTTDIKGRPISRALNMTANMVTWDQYGNDWKRNEKKVFSRTIETGSDGEANIDYTPDNEGYFEVTVSGKDSRGNEISSYCSIYVVKKGSYYSYYTSSAIELLLDKDTYAPGDEAKVLIRSQLGDVPAFITIEGLRIIDSRVLQLKNGSGYFSFKVTKEFQPNVDLALTVIKNNQLNQESKTIIAPPDDKFLNVTIESDKAVYKPGDVAKVKVTAVDKNGAPADAEVSLGAVDESIYAVKPETAQDIREFFYGLRSNRVTTQSSFWFYSYGSGAVQKMMEAPASMADMVMPRAESAGRVSKSASVEMVEPVIRSDFPDTAYWRAQIVTGPGGVADVQFTMPDTLTTWRLTSRGVTRDTSVGEARYKVIARKNVIIRLETPRFFTQGDKVNITAVIHNYLETEKATQAVLNVKGLKLLESNTKELDIPAGGEVRVEWLAIAESPQSAWITAKALTNEESDAMQLTIPVLPHGSPGGDAAAGEVAEKSEFVLNLPAKHIDGTEKLTLTIAPSLTSGMFDIFEYLAGYPYGCVEQTMSRFLPDVVIAEALQRAGRPLTGKLTELPKMVKDGLDRLADMQHSDSGWGWWKSDETNPYMTAYVIFGLSQAKRSDYQVSDDMYKNGIGALRILLGKEKNINTKAYMLFALAEAGGTNERELLSVFNKRKELSDYGKAVLAIACAKQNAKSCSSALAADLEKSAIQTKTAAHWESKTFHYSWTDNPVETTAFALMALIEAKPDSKLITKVVRYLNVTRRGDHWYSTKDTAAAVMALTRYMSKFEDQKPDYEFTVTVNGKLIETRKVTGKDLSGAGIRIEDIASATGKNTVVIEKKGKGNLYYYAALNYYESTDFLKARDNGIKVQRWFTWDAEGKQRLHAGTKLKSGDRIWAQIKVTPRTAYEYVMVENYLPSGFEVDQKNWSSAGYYYWSNRELRDEKAVFFIGYMWGNDYTASIPLRAETPGEISAMPCVASLMYFPEIGGRSDEAKFTVIP